MNKTEKMNIIWKDCFNEVTAIIRKHAQDNSMHPSNLIFNLSDPLQMNYQSLLHFIEIYSKTYFDVAFYKVLELYEVNHKHARFLSKDERDAVNIILLTINNKIYAFSFDSIYYPNSSELEKHLLTQGIDTMHFISLSYKAIPNRNAMIESFKYITIFEFFQNFISPEAKETFSNNLNKFRDTIQNTIGYKTIKTLDYSSRKHFITAIKSLYENDKIYNNRFKIIDQLNFDDELDKAEYIKCDNFQLDKDLSERLNRYFNENFGLSIITSNTDFAKSILTAEWLYSSLKDKQNFDYTSIISGYSKALEQFLSSIIKFYKGKNDILFISKKNKKYLDKNAIYYKTINNDLFVYYRTENDYLCKYSMFSYIEVLCEQLLQKYKRTDISNNQIEELKNLLHCFRVESRNGYFHTDNLYDIKIVEKTRTNFYILIFIIISYLKTDEIRKYKIGCIEEDKFNSLKDRIDRLYKQNNQFKLTTENLDTNEVVYHFTLNSDNFDEDGLETYESIYFVKIRETTNKLLLPYEPISVIKDSIIEFTRNSNYISLKWIDIDGNEIELL